MIHLLMLLSCISAMASSAAGLIIFEANLHTSEEEPVRTLGNVVALGNLQATLNSTSGLSYSLLEPDRYFEVGFSTGDIRIRARLDFEAMCPDTECIGGQVHHRFTAIVRDSSGVQVAHGSFIVTVSDVNDNAPTCTAVAPLQLEENCPPDSFVGQVQVFDRDSGSNSIFTCESQHSEKRSLPLKFVPNGNGSFNIYSMILIDRETDPTIIGTLTCSDQGIPSLTSTFTATVTILDRNDNRPQFYRESVNIEIAENNPLGQRVFQARATDLDIGDNGRLTYRLLPSIRGAERAFVIDSNSGLLLAREHLDRELRDSYDLLVAASDSGSPVLSSTMLVHIQVLDVNDNAPSFISSMQFQVEENREPGYLLGRLAAKDPDLGANGSVSLLLLNSPDLESFRMDPNGRIRTNIVFDREDKAGYTIRVRAQDDGIPRFSTDAVIHVRILDVNDNAPYFIFPTSSSQAWKVDIRTHQPGFIVLQVNAVDIDEGLNGRVVYSLVSGGGDLFAIDTKTAMVLVARKLDRKDLNRYKLTIRATDCAFNQPKSVDTVINIDVEDSKLTDKPFDPTNTPSVEATDVDVDVEETELTAKRFDPTNTPSVEATDVGVDVEETELTAKRFDPTNTPSVEATDGDVNIEDPELPAKRLYRGVYRVSQESKTG